jgi:photosystem II stability/assembly factor-like uncharacterized protein
MTTVYAILDDHLLAVRGAGTDWTASEQLSGRSFECLAASPAEPERVFAGTVDSGLLRSTDGGKRWSAVGGFEDRVTAVTVSPHDPDDVWVGTEPSAVYRSMNGGETFEKRDGLMSLPESEHWSFPPRPDTHHVRWIAINPHDSAHVYVAIEAGAFVRSVDGGRTWQPHPDGGRRDNHTLATHPDAPCRVYTAAGDGYAESPDCGDTWEYPQEGLEHRYVWGLAVDPGDPKTVAVSAANGAYSAHSPDSADAYVYCKSGSDEPWQVAMDGLPGPKGTVRAVLTAGDTGEFYALTNCGLFRSTDAAQSWDALPIEWPDAYRDQVGRGLAVV